MIKSNFKILHRIKFRLFSEFLKILIPLDRLILVIKSNSKQETARPIFIIGTPRSGSTLIYQILTSYYDFLYVNNFWSYFYHSFFLGYILNKLIFNSKTHETFSSNYGFTSGLLGPNETAQFWNNLFGEEHSTGEQSIKKSKKRLLKKWLNIIASYDNRPIIFKNLSNNKRIEQFANIFPDAVFIYCKREPIYNAQSILKARQRFYKNKQSWYSIKPKNYNQIANLEYPEQIVKQIFHLQKDIESDLKSYFPNQYLVISYENFCDDNKETIRQLESFLKKQNIKIYRRNKKEFPDLQASRNITIPKSDEAALKHEIQKIYSRT